MDLQDLSLFARVVEARSFSAVGRARGLATSAVSKRIARLEERLGVRLLERTTRTVLATEAGTAFYVRAARILLDVDEAEREIARFGGAPRGKLRVSAPVVFGERHVVPLLPAFLRRYPELRVDLSLNDRYVNLIEEQFDVVLRIGALEDSSLTRVRLGAAPSRVVAAPGYLETAGVPGSPADLLRHNCVRYTHVPVAREWQFRGPSGTFSVPVGGNIELNHGGAMLEMALAGTGIVRLPQFVVADALAAGTLVSILDEFQVPPSSISLLFPAAAASQLKTKAFVDAVGGELRARIRALDRR
jgi:DNA-binding transcriptional LysR family regulator